MRIVCSATAALLALVISAGAQAAGSKTNRTPSQKAENEPKGQKKSEQKSGQQKHDEQKAGQQKHDEQKADQQKHDEQKADQQKHDEQKAGQAAAPHKLPADETEGPKLLPPPAPPHAADQTPLPYLKTPPFKEPAPKVEVGPDFGVWLRPASNSTASYGAEFAWGIHARIEIAAWLGLRTFFVHSDLPVSLQQGALGLTDTKVSQPDLALTLLGGRLEPTWPLSRTFRAWLGAGVAWGRIVAPPLTTSGTFGGVRASERTGVLLEYSAAIGITADVIPHWLAASVSGSVGTLPDQSGSVFEGQQDSDRTGRSLFVGGLPKFQTSYSALFSLGILL